MEFVMLFTGLRRGGGFFFFAEGGKISVPGLVFFFFLLRVENVLTYGELSVGSLARAFGFFFFSLSFSFFFFEMLTLLSRAGRFAALQPVACAMHLPAA